MIKTILVFISIIVFVVGAIVLSNNFSNLQHGNASFVYETSSVDKPIAEQVHQYLIDQKVYEGLQGEVMLLKKNKAGVWVAKFPVYKGGDVAPEVLKDLQMLSLGIKKSVLNNEPLEIHITNSGYQSVQFFKI
ncbi:hypothetical protein [Pseudoalteromonas phenolica]|uniref:Uncharacterized protein n=2 Tax=Pseudoalteromonas phenolica TaxID=161398 RepID=A0A0S2K740_9GAMM|nr:hypothetical protein [Pseudoalteromonas phenolica]ALO44224.1 hypothetical protein PP2015_3752 [Pseudoalteromonas phenolica]MBE0357216.1 hypothetical protein [Pseudoalteromonas phenolica O-BC30]